MNSHSPDFHDELGEQVTRSLKMKVAKSSPSGVIWQRIKQNLQEDHRPKRRKSTGRLTLSLIPLSLAGLLFMVMVVSSWRMTPDQPVSPQLIASVNTTQMSSQQAGLTKAINGLQNLDQNELRQLRSFNQQVALVAAPLNFTDVPPADILPHPLSQLKRKSNDPVDKASTTDTALPAFGFRQLLP